MDNHCLWSLDQMTQLGIGSAQFGLSYGVTNSSGVVDAEVTRQILGAAKDWGIHYIDTAPAYGCSEQVLGKVLQDIKPFNIFGKVSVPNFDAKSERRRLTESLNQSLSNLHRENLEGLLLHDCSCLRQDGASAIIDWLYGVKDLGLTKSIGVSVYTPDDLEGIEIQWMDVVQVPSNPYDQRWSQSHQLVRLLDDNIEIHARSLFLQGLLLTQPEQFPKSLSKLAIHQEKMLAATGLSGLEAAFRYLRSQSWVDVAYIGVTSVRELGELVKGWESSKEYSSQTTDWAPWAVSSPELIDPRLWDLAR